MSKLALLVAVVAISLSGCSAIEGLKKDLALKKVESGEIPPVRKPAATPPATPQATAPGTITAPASSAGPVAGNPLPVEAGGKPTTFPRSKNKPKGTPWSVMHKDGYTGSYDNACRLLSLTEAQCNKYKEMHESGGCIRLEVANGLVLDVLTFTRGGVHRVQNQALVDLKDPPSRTAEVCHLGGGLYVGRFDVCNNQFRVDGSPPQQIATTPPPQNVSNTPPASGMCPGGKFLNLFSWKQEEMEKLFPEDGADIRAMASRDRGLIPGINNLPTPATKYGRKLRLSEERERLQLTASLPVELGFIRFESGKVVLASEIMKIVTPGHYLFDLSRYDLEGKVVGISIPSNLTGRRLVWPIDGHYHLWLRGDLWRDECTWNTHTFWERH